VTAVPDASPVTEVIARPIRMSKVGYASAAVVFVVFAVTAVLMPRDNAGAHFGGKDQLGTLALGIVLGGLFIMLTRPRLHADLQAVRMRSFLGGWRTVPWDLIVGVEFPKKVRFARILLPGDELLALYAVQRWDRAEAVVAMQGLRALFAATHPAVDE